MIYLDSFTFANEDQEFQFLLDIKHSCYDSFYPFRILSDKGFARMDFESITILYGGNGSGKTTALNVISEKVGLPRESIYNKSSFFPDYLKFCDFTWEEPLPVASKIITSDDVFEYLLNVRKLNESIDERREELFDEYLDAKYTQFQMKSLSDFGKLKRINSARSKTQSKFVRSNLMDQVRGYSNGESAFRYFEQKICGPGLYLLDEPENSLSPKRQLDLATWIEDEVRYNGSQFIISTHSPFLLAMSGAKVYDLDAQPVDVKRWTELSHVRTYYEFFEKHKNLFNT